jgi:UDP-hydrolysing UDP-N-acetyl-D-glucosamine 2-epimerase
MMRRRLALLTSGRQDWGILRSTVRTLADGDVFEPLVVAAGMHLQERHGLTVRLLEEEGVPVAGRLPTGDGAPAEQAARMLADLPSLLSSLGAEALVLAGDRSETAAAALAATLAALPLVHLHGGEESEGAIDNALRHAITKLSHLHLVSHPDHARRVVQMGEPPESVHVVGAPGLDNIHRADLPDRAALAAWLGLPLVPPVVLVTQHPTTLGGAADDEARALTDALAAVDATYVMTLPNSDAGAEAIVRRLRELAAARPGRVTLQPALGEARYFGMLKVADALVGNSSSALIEAPIAALPAVNVGDRQRGRLRGDNVLDVPATAAAIADGLRRALDPALRRRLSGRSPYGDGRSAPRIAAVLASWTPPSPPRKRFVERGPA